MKGFPLYAVEFLDEGSGGGFERVLGVDLGYFNRIIDIYRAGINEGKYEFTEGKYEFTEY